VREAMDHEKERRGGSGLNYNVYIIARESFGPLEEGFRETNEEVGDVQSLSRYSNKNIQDWLLSILTVSEGTTSISSTGRKKR
jgi:hypothetical protein